MFIYIIIALLVTLLAISYPRFDRDSKSLAYCLAFVVLFVFVGFRGANVDLDYRDVYIYFSNKVPDARYMFRDFPGFLNHLPPPELSFCVLVSLIKTFTLNVVPYVVFIYAFFSIMLKLKALRQLTQDEVFGFAVLVWFSNLFFLQEMTQMRAGLAASIFLLAIPSILEQNLKRYVLLILLATVIHRSAFIALPLYFLGTRSINFKFWVIAVIAVFVMAKMRIDMLSIILDYNVPILHHKLVIYQKIQGWTKFEVNLFNVIIILQFLAACVLYWKREVVLPRCPHLYFLIKVCMISVMAYYFFVRIPVFAFRLSDFLGCVTIILYPMLYYVLKPKEMGQLLVVGIAWCTMLLNLFHNNLMKPYYMCFFD